MATPLTADQLVKALKAEGVKVSERSGWRTHNRNSAGAWGPVNGVLIHHTAGSNSLALCYSGRSDLPGPLCHTHLAKNGTATMVGNGRANHAGKAAANAFNALVAESGSHPKPSSSSGTVDGNARLYGLEIENLGTGKDPYPDGQYDQAVRWAAAICRAHGWSAHSVAGHKETSIEGKIDPSFDMNTFRSAVAERLKHAAGWTPSGDDNEEDDMALSNDDIRRIFRTDGAVPAARPPVANADYEDGNTEWAAGTALQTTVEGVRKTQKALGAVASDIDKLTAKVDTLTQLVQQLLADKEK